MVLRPSSIGTAAACPDGSMYSPGLESLPYEKLSIEANSMAYTPSAALTYPLGRSAE